MRTKNLNFYLAFLAIDTRVNDNNLCTIIQCFQVPKVHCYSRQMSVINDLWHGNPILNKNNYAFRKKHKKVQWKQFLPWIIVFIKKGLSPTGISVTEDWSQSIILLLISAKLILIYIIKEDFLCFPVYWLNKSQMELADFHSKSIHLQERHLLRKVEKLQYSTCWLPDYLSHWHA